MGQEYPSDLTLCIRKAFCDLNARAHRSYTGVFSSTKPWGKSPRPGLALVWVKKACFNCSSIDGFAFLTAEAHCLGYFFMYSIQGARSPLGWGSSANF
eukprot:1268832-Alexandrium_andersonii.AAC.1